LFIFLGKFYLSISYLSREGEGGFSRRVDVLLWGKGIFKKSQNLRINLLISGGFQAPTGTEPPLERKKM